MHNRTPRIIIAPAVFILAALTVILLPLRLVGAWIAAVLVHECGHLIATLLSGASIRCIRVMPFGIVMESDGLTPGKQIISSIAGPAAGVCLSLLFRWFPLIAALALVQTVLNLLPIKNMDGSVILCNVLLLLCKQSNIDRICCIADIASRALLVCICLIAAWKLSWGFAWIVTVLLLVRLKRNPCKQSRLKVQ